MKKVTCTITRRNIDCIMFNNETEQLERNTVLYIGEKFDGIERDYVKGYQILKVKGQSEPIETKYEMEFSKFMYLAKKSENYKVGFLNRSVEGSIYKIKCYDNLAEEVVVVDIIADNEKMAIKTLDNDMIFLKTLSVEKTEKTYYYMSFEDFTSLANIVEK